MIVHWLVVTAVTLLLLWLYPAAVYVATMVLAFHVRAHLGPVPVVPIAVTIAFYAFAVWRWPYCRCWLCGRARWGRGRNYGSKKNYWGRCPLRCRSGEMWRPGARLIARLTRSRYARA